MGTGDLKKEPHAVPRQEVENVYKQKKPTTYLLGKVTVHRQERGRSLKILSI